jgi:hypothetical protein
MPKDRLQRIRNRNQAVKESQLGQVVMDRNHMASRQHSRQSSTDPMTDNPGQTARING